MDPQPICPPETMIEAMRRQFAGRRIQYAAGRKAQLIHHLDLRDFGGPGLTLADLDGDGRAEFLFRQEAGGYNRPDQRTDGIYRPEWLGVNCTTAVRLDGTVLWQHGAPWRLPVEYPAHGTTEPAVGDFDADGAAEVVELDGGSLALFEGATGRERRRISLAPEMDIRAITAYLPRAGAPGFIVARFGGNYDSSTGRTTGQRMYLFDHELKLVFGPVTSRFSGHAVASANLRGDGEQILIDGFCAYDRTGRKLWECADSGVPEGSHVDSILCVDLNGDGRDELVYCLDCPRKTEHSMVAVGGDGRTMWKAVSTHPQKAAAGCVIAQDVRANERFHYLRAPGEPGPQVFLGQKFGGIGAYGPDGKFLWRRDDISAYPLLVRPTPSSERILWEPHRMESLAPFVDDGRGNVAWQFAELLEQPRRLKSFPVPCPAEGEQKPIWFRRPHDWSVGFRPNVYPVELDGVRCEEIVLSDRSDLWVYRIAP